MKIDEIKKWLNEYDSTKVSHVLIVIDESTNNIYSVPIEFDTYIQDVINEYNDSGQRVLEVYSLNLNIDEQLQENKAWNITLYSKPESKKIIERPNWHQMWMSMAFQCAQKSIDPSTKHGCILVNSNNKILSLGYNSFPANCLDSELPLTRPEKYEAIVHAETNAIINANCCLEGATAYITGFPCSRCFGNILNARIAKIIYGPVTSHCMDEERVKLIELMNISSDSLANKIEIIKYEDIEDLEKIYEMFNMTQDYIKSKSN